MKAILDIELEIDGTWYPEDRERLVEKIMEDPGGRVWEIDDDRLAVVAKSMTVALEKKRDTTEQFNEFIEFCFKRSDIENRLDKDLLADFLADIVIAWRKEKASHD